MAIAYSSQGAGAGTESNGASLDLVCPATVNANDILFDHVGWITNDLKKFEGFWVKTLGFKKIWQSHLSSELTRTLFRLPGGARCLRYQKGKVTIECHVFDKP